MAENWGPFQEILETPLIEDKSILDILEYENYSQWWTIEYNINTYALNLPRPSNGLLSFNSPIYSSIICNKYLNILFNFWYDLINYSLFTIENKIHHTPKSHGNENSNLKIVYRQGILEWRSDNNANPSKLINIYHSDIISQLPQDIEIIPLYDSDIISFKEYHSKLPHIISSDRRNIPCVYWKYWSWSTWLHEKESIIHFYKIWKRISNMDNWFAKWCEFAGTNVNEFKRYFKRLIVLTIPKAVSYFEMADQLISIEKPSAIVLTNETSMYGRAWINAAKKHAIPSIAIQHGAFYENDILYCCRNHDPKDISVRGKEIGTSYPIPDITCVWSQSEYDILVKCAGYPKDQVIITGNPRYDYLGCATEKYSIDAFCAKYNINPTNRIILWATSTHSENHKDNIEYINEVISACNAIPNITLIIKQHPQEQSEHTKLYLNAIKENNDRFQIVLPNKMEDTTEMVFASDVLIIKDSTVGQEAVAFNKPIIIFDFSETKDLAGYIKENVAVPAYRKGSLHDALVTCLENNPITKSSQERYVINHMYKLDGLASKRIAKIIEESIT